MADGGPWSWHGTLNLRKSLLPSRRLRENEIRMVCAPLRHQKLTPTVHVGVNLQTSLAADWGPCYVVCFARSL